MFAVNKKNRSPITASVEIIEGHAGIVPDSFKRGADGKLTGETTGATKMLWDSSATVTEHDQQLFVDDNGEVVPENEIELTPDDPWVENYAFPAPEDPSDDAVEPRRPPA